MSVKHLKEIIKCENVQNLLVRILGKFALQTNLVKRSPLLDDHLSKTTNVESAQASSHKIVPG